MKQFFYIVFGGLAVIIIAFFGIKIHGALRSAKSAVPANPVEVYSAKEEEDQVNTTYDLWSSTATTSLNNISAKAYILVLDFQQTYA